MQPLTHVHNNIVFGRNLHDVWAVYRLSPVAYTGLTYSAKNELRSDIAALAYHVAADFQILRLNRPWSADEYAYGALRKCSRAHGHHALWAKYIETHRQALSHQQVVRPDIYMAIRLLGASGTSGGALSELASSINTLMARLGGPLGLSNPRGLSNKEIQAIEVAERRARHLLDSFGQVRATPVSSDTIEWLVRRSFSRGIGDPKIDYQFHLRAEAVTFANPDGDIAFEPLSRRLLRWQNAAIYRDARLLRIVSEEGESYQAQLVVGALPELRYFPGDDAELLFSPLERAGFPVDASFSVRWVENKRAIQEIRKKKIDADQQFREETYGEHGPSPETAQRPMQVRDLEEDLTSTARPPMLHGGTILSVGAASIEQLEERVDRLRAAFGTIALHRPIGHQHRYFQASLPGQAFPSPALSDPYTIDEFGAMVPLACDHGGSAVGPYIGYTLGLSHQPILWDMQEAHNTDKPPTTLIAGTLGSGKTMFLQLALQQAFMRGSRVVDIDPKGDHNLANLPGVAEHLETIELSGEARYRGLLDPLRISRPEARFDMTVNFLMMLLQDREEFSIEVSEAVKYVIEETTRSGEEPTCLDVVEVLAAGGMHGATSPTAAVAQQAARALRVYVDAGLAQLGFADPNNPPPAVGKAQVVSLRVRNLPRPNPGTPRDQFTPDERIGAAVLGLVAIYAMHLMGEDRSRHKALGFDEAWFLLQDSSGRKLIEQLMRWGRSENATLLLVTHMVGDSDQLDNLIGPRFIFGMESEEEMRKALALLHLDTDDAALIKRGLSFRKGRCFFRDSNGQVVQMQVDLVDDELLRALSTTPPEEQPSAVTGRATADAAA